MSEPSDPAPEVIVALDHPSGEEARAVAEQLPSNTWLKVGLQLFTVEGPRLVEELVNEGHPVFLDLKFHDIPNTVMGAARAAAGLGVRLLSVHSSGGQEMIRAAVEGASVSPTLRILAVTVLTSLSDRALEEVMATELSPQDTVGRLAALAHDAGAHGAVASVGECRAVKLACGADFLVATPGIRLPGEEAHDQKRVATPSEARLAGADYLVVGRSVTQAEDPARALGAIQEAAVRKKNDRRRASGGSGA